MRCHKDNLPIIIFGILLACSRNVTLPPVFELSHLLTLLRQPAAHMSMWIMSDRAIPRSYRMMQGFGVNTFTLHTLAGEQFFVKFHWIPELGVHSLVWDEALKISGQDPGESSTPLLRCLQGLTTAQTSIGKTCMKRSNMVLSLSGSSAFKSFQPQRNMISSLTFLTQPKSGQKTLFLSKKSAS
jgi:hypothetical protein